MRQKNIVKIGAAFLLSILVLVLVVLVNGANIKSFAQGSQNVKIGEIIELSNALENKYEEINFSLFLLVRGFGEKKTDGFQELIDIQEKLNQKWVVFNNGYCKETKICKTNDDKDLAQRIDEYLQSLENIKPLFAEQEQTLSSQEIYGKYNKFLASQGTSTSNQIQSPILNNNIVQTIQDFINEDLKKAKEELQQNLQQANNNEDLQQIEEQIKAIETIETGIESESGIFFKKTQAGLEIVSREKSRSIEKDLLQINDRFLTQSSDSKISYPGVNTIRIIFGWLVLLTIGILVYLYFKLFRKNKKSEDTSTDNQGSSASKDNFNTDEITKQFSTLYDKSTKDIQQVQNLFYQELKQIELDSRAAYQQALGDNTKVLNNLAISLKNKDQELSQLLIVVKESLDVIKNKNTNTNQEDGANGKKKVNKGNDKKEKEDLRINNSPQKQSILLTLKNSDKLEDLVNNYNHKTINKSNIVKVSATKESIEKRRTGDNAPLILMQENEGNEATWVVTQYRLQDNCYFLVPKSGLIINDRIYQTIEDIFMCKGYKNRASNDFKLMLPA
ncbi:MAG: hypothetical protein QNJ55_19515, partial [Xenococcus sp. MO_188.B8]|nr:hypothetical protein [Xenococcus sp. MO_188.B8]